MSKIIGDGLGEVEHSIGALTAQASEWFDTFLRSIWSGGQALISMLSLTVITPVIACYLLFHWNAMITAIDDWVPPAGRETVRALAREIDDTIGGFVRGQSALCLILAVFYAAALHLLCHLRVDWCSGQADDCGSSLWGDAYEASTRQSRRQGGN